MHPIAASSAVCPPWADPVDGRSSTRPSRTAPRATAARDNIKSCDARLNRYRAALEAGTDPVLVQQRAAQVQAEKAVAEAALRSASGRRHMTAKEIGALVEALSGIAAILRAAEPQDKADVYRQLGIKLTYKPGPRLIQAEALPSDACISCVRRGT
jgi:site-specific DNA recombinase